ncbi:thiol peroxidase [Phytohabitans rumicis]|uniref:Thiol peroxidase n=1 Tax=Phytohabitans rumicis TaxID=1076125 RepID=A0A6V8LGY6_9ACTN|nr:thiol peroxidase [Phytohabitans rumicis]GFJ96512.1 putative thiol peroxidase [Phytohabitans rumicis]
MTIAVERAGVVTFRGRPVTLIGTEVSVGDRAPDFVVVGNDFAPVTLAASAGTVRILSVVPSLDTEVCDRQTRRFNEEAAGMAGVPVLTISVDLPFAQRRWCGAADLDNVVTLSDHRELSFGLAYGVVISEFRLLARAVFVVDANDRIAYAQYVPEVGEHPDYPAALSAAGLAAAAQNATR